MPPLTYAQVRSTEIDVDAQRSLMRMSNRPATSDTAACIAAAVQSGTLLGIYAQDQKKPALRARDKLNRGWWQLIPPGEDSVVVLDRTDPTAPPLITFRRTIRGDNARIDAAILKAWRTARLYLSGKIIPCAPGVASMPATNIVPGHLCSIDGNSGDAPDCCCQRIDSIRLFVRTVIPEHPRSQSAVLLTERPCAGKTAVLTRSGYYLTDQRDFDSSTTASARTSSAMFLNTDNGRNILSPTRVGETIVVDGRYPNELVCCRPERLRRTAFRRIAGPPHYQFQYSLNIPDDCAPQLVTMIDGTFELAIAPTFRSVRITFSGSFRAFNMEVYALINTCLPWKTVLQETLPGASLMSDTILSTGSSGPFTRSIALTCGPCICAGDGTPRMLPLRERRTCATTRP
jgi:hypothetical protein